MARSAGIQDDRLPEGRRLSGGFGERPTGVACPASIFAQTFGKDLVAVVQVADLGFDAAGRAAMLGFRLLVMARRFYSQWIGDPFLVADRFPPIWHARGELPVLTWPAEPTPWRTVEMVQAVLQRVDTSKQPEVAQSPILLGATQALVDGGRVVFERAAPDTSLLRGLWTLLPASTRAQLWPASFAFSNALGFDAVVVPSANPDEFQGYLTEEQAGDYPEGRYELRLQIAAEAGDQGELDVLFARRSTSQTFRLLLILIGLMIVLLVGMKLLTLNP
jgi:hypothetical protein